MRKRFVNLLLGIVGGHLKKSSFTWKVIRRVMAIFLLNWMVLVGLFIYKTKHEFELGHIRQHNIYQEKLNGVVSNVKGNLKNLLINIGGQLPKNQGQPRLVVVDSLTRSWNLLSRQYLSMEMELYSPDGNSEYQWGLLDRSRPSVVFPPSVLEEARQVESGVYFFRCEQICMVYALKTVAPYSLSQGLILLTASIDDVLQSFNILHKVDVFAYRMPDGEAPIVFEAATNPLLARSVSASLEGGGTGPFMQLENGGRTLVVYRFPGLVDGLLLFVVEDISPAQDILNDTLRQTFWMALLASVLMVLALYLLMNRSMRRLGELSEAMPAIGAARFDLAKQYLSRSMPERASDELDLIHLTIYQAASRLGQLHESLRESNENLRRLANHDMLTGLPNRRYFHEECARELDEGRSGSVALVILDIDHFKIVNDTLGHAMGDQLLVDVAGILSSEMVGRGVVGRMGGDEFALLLPGIPFAEVAGLLERISVRVAGVKLSQEREIGEIDQVFSLSIGVASCPEDTAEMEALFFYADVAMYENKKLKSGLYHRYTGGEKILKTRFHAKYWNDVIDAALRNDQLTVNFQPLVDPKDGSIYSYEVLARIQPSGEENQFVTADFIQYAERNHTIIVIDKRVIEMALGLASQREPKPRLMINLSNLTLAVPGMMEYILDRVGFYAYPPSLLTFEVTESVEISDLGLVRDFMRQLKSAGFRFALDDFGAGYSSFTYLERLNFDFLKIDKEITKSILNSEKSFNIFRSIVIMANNLGVKVIVEGIENPLTMRKALTCDVDLLQGFYFYRPARLLR